jgi:hypothetical protein
LGVLLMLRNPMALHNESLSGAADDCQTVLRIQISLSQPERHVECIHGQPGIKNPAHIPTDDNTRIKGN